MLEENLKTIFDFVKNGNNVGENITVVGATKTQNVETIMRAVNSGLKVVAENRVQEFNEKWDKLKNVDQQFIGHLQTNKVKYIVGKVSLIQSVDSLHLAESISECALKKGIVQNILVEVNIGNEESKSGVNIDEVENAVKDFSALKCIAICGLMGMLPKSDDAEYLKSLCIKIRSIYDKLKNKGYNFNYLSVGMSGDYKIAVQNGSNMIRIGSAIFGLRN